MGSIFFTSDHHFGHENILRFQPNRNFATIEEHDEELIQRWNERVGRKDVVYHLGDFSLGESIAIDIFHKLNGIINIVPGGHDWRWIRYLKMGNSIAMFGIVDDAKKLSGKVNILDPLVSLEIPQPGEKYPLTIVLCHYSLRIWDKSHYNSFHLYGHSHGRLDGIGRSMDIGVDTNNLYPYLLDEIISKLSNKNNHNKIIS